MIVFYLRLVARSLHLDPTGLRRRRPRRPVGLLVAVPVLLAIGCSDSPDSWDRLSDSERQAVRSVEQAYVEAWGANDRDAVMATLTDDAVLFPDGMGPIRGDSAIRAFWWPRDSSETRVTSYETTVDEIGGAGTVAFLSGTGHLEFDWRESTNREWQSFTSRSVWMALLRRQPGGEWRMTHRMWHSLDGE